MKSLPKRLFILCLCTISCNVVAQSTKDINGQITCQGCGIPNVVVTNGFDCTLTNDIGEYSIPYHRDARFVYVTTPAAYLPPKQYSLPCYYQRISDGVNKYDFTLIKNPKDDNAHTFLVQSDVQVANASDVEGYVKYLRDVRQYLDKQIKKNDLFMIDCGDIVGNAPSVHPLYIKATDILDIPVYRTIGNHDMEYGVRSYEHSYKTFESYFGPIYYSFNRGKAHYIVLNNNYYINRNYRYIGYIDERTLQWLERDLEFVPKHHLVFVFMHIPSSSTKELKFNALLPDETSNAASLYSMLKGYEAHIITGHTHNNRNVVFNDSLMEHNTAAVCGTFWKADICTDGTPSGYGIYKVNGNKVTWIYKSMGYPTSYQFRAYPVESSDEYPQDIIANVWNWDELWKVEWYEDGKYMGNMERFEGYDPEAKIICSDKEKVVYDWIKPIKTEHLFRATPNNRNALLEICVTDRFGRVYKECIDENKYN